MLQMVQRQSLLGHSVLRPLESQGWKATEPQGFRWWAGTAKVFWVPDKQWKT